MSATSDLNPLVSVYIPTRNRSALVERAIRSVLQQNYAALEIIVVDDASVDDTELVVRRLVTTGTPDRNIVYCRQDVPAGACAARNLAINAARGHYITGLDDDDYFEPDRISRLVMTFDPDECSFVFDGYVRETRKREGSVSRALISLEKSASLIDLLKRNIVGNQVFTLTSRMRAVGGFDESLPAWQDYDLWIRLVQTFGEARPAYGHSYVYSVDNSQVRISNNTEKIERAFEIFVKKYPQYEDPALALCLRLAKVCYGINAISLADLPRLVLLGEPRYVLFATYSWLATRLARRISR